MKTSKWIALTAAATIFGGGLFVLGAAPAKTSAGEGHGRGHLLQHAREQLNLTDEQVSQVKAVLKGDKENITSLLTRMHEARNGMRAAIRAAAANESSVRAAAAKVAVVEADLAVERMKLYGKISPILTPEQRDKLQQFETQIDNLVEKASGRLGSKRGE